ncbi:MAG: hypothetical protein KF861_05475 [Planctomycetaceae bacterium]|nr:hypothetical protein [Planctomycetaceae bacterium]
MVDRRPVAAPVFCTVAAVLLIQTALSGPQAARRRQHNASAAIPIENLRVVSSSILCGAEPHGPDAFSELRRLGVRTIVSVDGARPDVESAGRAGLRYVHIPIGYDGVPREATRQLMQVLQECERPIFVHCHHGKHRGPAAAAVCAIFAGELDRAGGLALLKEAGTNPDYVGLWRDVGEATATPLDGQPPVLVEIAEPAPIVDVMVRIDHSFEQLSKLTGSGGTNNDARPSPQINAKALELAVQLYEEFREAARLGAGGNNDDLQLRMEHAEKAALELVDAVRSHPEAVPGAVAIIQEQCQTCHKRHRN